MSEKKPALRAVDTAAPMHVKAPERLSDILAEPLPEWQVVGLIPRASTVVLFGDSQAGKTFFALDIAASIATGRALSGRQVRQGSVLYVAAEGYGGFGKRLRALVQRFPDLPASPFRVLRQAIDFRTHHNELLVRARDVEEDGGRLGLIVIDTLSQTIFGDENGTDMTDYISRAGLLAGETGAPVMIAHHQGKDAAKGARGSSSLRGNSDVMIRLVTDAAGNRVATTDPAQGGKSRDGEPVSVGFRLRALEVGGNQTSCVVDYQDVGACSATVRKHPAGAAQKLLYQLAGDLAKAAGAAGARRGGRPVLRLDDLEKAWAAAKTATGQSKQASPSYMSRPLAGLVEAGLLAQDGELLWHP